MPEIFRFMDPQGLVESWDGEKHGTLPEQGAICMIDTADLHNIGQMRDPACRAREIFFIDHHEVKSDSSFTGICDSKAASACELMVELALAAGAALDSQTAFAAYTGIVYDTGFFSYQKTGARTFKNALMLLEAGVNPNEAHRQLRENATVGALLLQKKALSSLELHCRGRVASQILRLEDYAETGALSDDSDGLVNVPLRSRDIVVSLLVRESERGKTRCSMRSKGTVDVSKIAHEFGGGGHVNAAGFKSKLDVDQILDITIAKIARYLDRQ
jgi:phosphoesterase RecJ-like protein